MVQKSRKSIKLLRNTFQSRHQNITHKTRLSFYISYSITFTLTPPKKKKIQRCSNSLYLQLFKNKNFIDTKLHTEIKISHNFLPYWRVGISKMPIGYTKLKVKMAILTSLIHLYF